MTSLPLPGAVAWRLPEDSPQALLTFLDHALPTLLRRLRLWKGLAADRHPDIIEDLLQELWLDYLTHREKLLAMTQRERNLRWFRLLARSHYRWREQGQKHLGSEKLGELVHEAGAGAGAGAHRCLARLRAHERQLLARLEEEACYLKNGRLNAQETARRLQVSQQTLRRLWEQVAEATGFGDGFVGFWCRRLGEALTALGLDLCRGGAGFRRHLRRIQRIREHLRQRPLPMHLKRLLARYRRQASGLTPEQVLADAARLQVHPHTSATEAPPAVSRSTPAPAPDRRRSASGRARQAG